MSEVNEVSSRGGFERELIMGRVSPGKDMYAKVKRWDDSPTVQWVMKRNPNASTLLVHLFIMPDAVLASLEDLRQEGVTLGDLVTYTEKHIGDLVEEFLPTVPVREVQHLYFIGGSCEILSTPHVGVLIGHKDIFSRYVVKESDTFIRPHILTAEVREHTRQIMAREGND